MNGCKGSCITLAAIAGASAAIAGGILAVSSATADSPKTATLAARADAAVQADHLSADREALAVSNSSPTTFSHGSVDAGVQNRTSSFEDTFEGMRRRMRVQFARPLDPDLKLPTTEGSSQQLQGPNPCAGPTSGFSLENDNRPLAQNGSGLDEPSTIDCTAGSPPANYEGWRGKNDSCWLGPTLFQVPSDVDTIPTFTNINQSYSFAGQTMSIDNSCHLGDANHDSLDRDPDVWHLVISGVPALDMKMTGYAEIENIRMAMTFNLTDYSANGTFGPITDCSELYGIFLSPVWTSSEIDTTANCADGTWQESLQEGNWYILIFPATPGGGGPGYGDVSTTTGEAFWYNVTVESIDPLGACCDTDTATCTDGSLKSTCLSGAGVFEGNGSTCATSSCCSPITDLGATPADWEEDNVATYGSASELRCNDPSGSNINEIAYDFYGNLTKCGTTPLTLAGNEFDPVDPCDTTYNGGDGQYVIVGFGGTADAFSSTFASNSLSASDDDCFTFNVPGPDPVRIEATFYCPFSYVGYIVRDFGQNPLAPDCDVVGYLGGGVAAPCQLTRLTQCLRPGVHGVYMQHFATANVSCDVRYTITLQCLDCVPGACCLKAGTCVDGVPDPTCEFDMHGIFQGNWSSCCASLCVQPCDDTGASDVNPPQTTTNPSIADDDCTDYTTVGASGPETSTGDLINSGCEAPDGNQAAYWSLAPGSNDRLWCAHTGTYILDSGLSRDFIGDIDYYELDLSGENDDTQVAITLQSQMPLNLYVARERDRNSCPSIGVDGTDDVRALPTTVATSTATVNGINQVTLTLCLSNQHHIILVDSNVILDCGFFYTMQLDFEPNCQGACCIAGAGCQNVTEDSTDSQVAQAACDTLKGTYRGLGTRCPGTGGTNPLGRTTEIDCCTISAEANDVIDADSGNCQGSVNDPTTDPNGGCAQGGTFQSLGTLDPLQNGGASSGSDVVSVSGTCGAGTQTVPPFNVGRDRDFYSFDIPAGPDAELLVFLQVNFNELFRILDTNDLDPANACDYNTGNTSSFTINAGTCVDGGQTFGVSGLLTDGSSSCLDAGETHYVFVQSTGKAQCSLDYRFSLQTFECRLGACCLDNALCVGQNDVGFVECEGILGGTFVAGASCPTGNNEGTLCLGVCCIDDDADPQTPTVCQASTLYQECCIGNGALTQLDPNAPGYSQGAFLGYEVGDTPASCTPNACVPSGACCVDDVNSLYICNDDVTPADCATMGGVYQGDDTLCSNSPCDSLLGACCVGSSCVDPESPLHCGGLGGTFQGAGTDCAGVSCAPAGGACCYACPDGNTCVDVADLPACQAAGGLYAGSGTSCGSFTCSTLCAGDLNGDGLENVFDFGTFATNFGTTSGATRCDGDFNCDGAVNVFDFSTFATNFGCSGPATGSCP